MPGYPELRQQVDELALRLVLATPGTGQDVAGWTQSLEEIHSGAIGEGAAEAAETVRSILAALQVCGDSELPLVLQEGIPRLQQAFEDHQSTSGSRP
jgi:hypothetical protein